jgi:acyl carrier protein
LNLEQAIADNVKRSGKKPGFVFLFSSLASILGGFSMTAYTAANRFMDAFVQNNPRKHGVAWICANWDDWDFKYTKEQAAAYEHTTAQFAMGPEEGVETLERIVSLPAAVQVLVATRAMQPRVEQWLHQTRQDGQQLSAPAGNQQALTVPQASSPEKPITPAAVSSDGLDRQMLEVFREVLETPDMSVEESFFEVGGDSLMASQILLKLRRTVKEYASQLSLNALFDHPTVRGLTLFLGGTSAAETPKTSTPSVSVTPQTAEPVAATPSANGLEQQILDVFRDVLETPDMSPEESFFEVGGDSLMASQILLKLRRSLKEHTQHLSLGSLFENPSVRALTNWLTQNAS